MMTNANDHTDNQELQPDAQQIEELACALDGCAATYSLLARIYRHELDQDAIDEIRAMCFPAHTGSEYMDQGYRGIASYLSKVGAAAAGELEVDYSRTFIGGGIDSYSAAYPYESVHAGRKRLMMQAARDEVLAIYSAYGLAKSGAVKEGEDHIACDHARHRRHCRCSGGGLSWKAGPCASLFPSRSTCLPQSGSGSASASAT